ncbi:regulator [Vibrio qinghaiensis]|jgi:tetratricopeptide (TPR) repeat protein|uniref:Regulator n=1 Tax=Vibrio qinghaiensis TaxID=2025808 RepID=A0A223MXY6_9VIBR|nr:regulator [Vibrio qinghaiensis]ASU22429.1 regulator [Vibrio qinghaiensis]
MKEVKIDFNTSDEESLALLDSKSIEHKLSKLRQSKKVTIDELKKIFDLGVRFYNELQFKEAEIVFSSYTSLNPYDHRGPGSLAAIYLEKGQFTKALDVLNILKTYPTNDLDETILNIALCHYKLKEHLQSAAMLLIVKSENLNEFNSKRYTYLHKQLRPYL